MVPMTDQIDLLVIGGGITGQCAALAAAEHGACVRIVDFKRNAGSHANAGSLHVQMQSRFLRLNPHLADNLESSLPLYLEAVAAWEALDRKLGGVELTREGGLMLADSPEQMTFLRQKAEREAKKGLSVDILDRDALPKIAPYLGSTIMGAEICHDEGKLNPLIANRKLEARLTELGVEHVYDRIIGFDMTTSNPIAKGTIDHSADQIVIAAAWGSGALANELGLAIKTPPEPLHMNITEAGDYRIHHLIQHAERPITLKQFRSGQVVIGGGWSAQAGEGDGIPTILSQSLLGNVALAATIAPGIGGLRLLRTWAGYNTPVDGKATIGPTLLHPRLHLALPGDAGYTLGPVVCQCAAALAMGFDPLTDPTPYAVSRWT